MCGSRGRHEVVAADADDLLGDVRLDREVAAPGRDGRIDDLVTAGLDGERLVAGGDRDARARGGRRRLDPDPGQQRALLVGREGRPEQAVDPRRPERDVRRRRLDRVRIDAPGRDLAAGPFGDEPRGPVGAEPRQARLLALLEAQAGLGSQRVAERRPADADRVEDGRFDDDVGRPSPISDVAPPMTPAIPIGPVGSAMTSVSGSSSRTTWSSVSSRSPAAARRTTIRPSWTAAASNVWIGLPNSTMT